MLRVATLLSFVLAATSLTHSSARVQQSSKAAPVPSVQIEMQNVNLYVDDGIVLVVRRLRGRMESRTPERPPIFDDGRSYVLNVDQGEMSIGMRSLDELPYMPDLGDLNAERRGPR